MAINRKIRVIGCASGWGAQIIETEKGPEAFQASNIVENLYDDGLDISWDNIVYPVKKHIDLEIEDRYDMLSVVAEVNKRLSTVISDKLYSSQFPLVLGGDHAMASGTWSTVAHYYGKEHSQDIGLIWVDAHMDANTYATSYSKAIHGMPVAALLGATDFGLDSICPKPGRIKPENLVLVGIRSFESGERDFLNSLGVKIFYMDDIKKHGFKKIWADAISYVKSKTNKFGLSIDLDAFDPSEAPGVGSPEGCGILFEDFRNSDISQLSDDSDLIALEIAEYNPDRDLEHKTIRLTEDILRLILLGR